MPSNLTKLLGWARGSNMCFMTHALVLNIILITVLYAVGGLGSLDSVLGETVTSSEHKAANLHHCLTKAIVKQCNRKIPNNRTQTDVRQSVAKMIYRFLGKLAAGFRWDHISRLIVLRDRRIHVN